MWPHREAAWKDPERQATAVVGIAIVLLLMSGVLRIVWRNRAWLRTLARSALREARARAAVRQWRKPGDPLEQRVREKCEERRVARARSVIFVFALLCAASETVHVQRVLTGQPLSMTLTQAMVHHLLAGGVVIQLAFPRFMTAKVVDAIFLWDMALLAVSIAGSGEDAAPVLGGASPLFFLASSCCCLYNLKPWVNAIGLAVLAVTTAVVQSSDSIYVWTHHAALWSVLCWIDHIVTAAVRLEIEATDSGQQLAAIKTLLGTICDVVVELGDDLRLVYDSAKLSDLLLHGSGRSLQGATIQEFMPVEDDRRKFVEQVSGVDRASLHAEVFHAKLSDCNAAHISMEFFSVAFAGPDARRRHLLGMREFTDIKPLTQDPQRRPPPVASSEQAPPLERKARQDWPGTPASSEHGDILQHAGGSQSSGSTSRTLLSAAPGQPKRTTSEMAMRLSLLTTMMSWQVRREGACCQLHALVAHANGAAGEIAAWSCNAAFRPNEEWQCERCGIVADEYRPSSRQRVPGCLLCRSSHIDPERTEGGGRPGLTAL